MNAEMRNVGGRQRTSTRIIEFIIFDDHCIPHYEGSCKLFLNAETNIILIKPGNPDILPFSTSFDSYFILEQNIIYNEWGPLEAAFIFPDQICAHRFYKTVVTQRTTFNIVRHSFKEKLILPLIKQSHCPNINEILLKFIHFCDDEKKKEYYNLLEKQRKSYYVHSPGSSQNSAQNVDISFTMNNKDSCCAYKRKKTATKNTHEDNQTKQRKNPRRNTKVYNTKQIVHADDYKIIKYSENGQTQERLLIFNAQDRSFVHIFKWNSVKRLFECLRCQEKPVPKTITVARKKDNSGKEFLYLNRDTHSCRVQRYENVDEELSI